MSFNVQDTTIPQFSLFTDLHQHTPVNFDLKNFTLIINKIKVLLSPVISSEYTPSQLQDYRLNILRDILKQRKILAQQSHEPSRLVFNRALNNLEQQVLDFHIKNI
jgi:hypothetical protein